MKLTKRLAIGAIAGGIAAAPAVAQEAEAAFDRLDADGNGHVSWAEAYDVRTSEFTEMDADMNGILAEEEFQGPARPLSAFDTDGDMTLSLAEFLQGHRSMFDRFDEDADGALVPDEFEAARSAARSD